MNFFKPVYDGITNGFKWMRDAAGINFYAFLALVIVLISVIAGVVILLLSQEAKTSRRLVKINNYLVKNKKVKRPDFFNRFTKLVTKGNNRVVIAWQGYVFQNGKNVSDVFKDNRLYSGYHEHSNFVAYVGYLVSFFLFVLSIGVLSVGSTNVLGGLYEALIFPLLIISVVFVYSCFYSIYRKTIQNKLVEYSKAIAESIDVFFVDEKENLEELKKSMFKKLIEFADENIINELAENNKETVVYLDDSASLEKQRAQIRAQFDKEIKELKDRGDQLEDDIRKNREELLEVRTQIKETDDKTVITSLKQQEDSQLKLISALEKLKGAQQKQYIEVEAKLQTELKRIDETINERRKTAEEKMKKELDEFADNLLVEKRKQIENNSQKTAQAEEVKTTKKAENISSNKSNSRKNINEALSELLTAMNKYTDNKEEK